MRKLNSFKDYPCECGKITLIVPEGMSIQAFKEYGAGVKSFGVLEEGTHFFAGNLQEKLLLSNGKVFQIGSMQDDITYTLEPATTTPVENEDAQIDAAFNQREYSNQDLMTEIKSIKLYFHLTHNYSKRECIVRGYTGTGSRAREIYRLVYANLALFCF